MEDCSSVFPLVSACLLVQRTESGSHNTEQMKICWRPHGPEPSPRKSENSVITEYLTRYKVKEIGGRVFQLGGINEYMNE